MKAPIGIGKNAMLCLERSEEVNEVAEDASDEFVLSKADLTPSLERNRIELRSNSNWMLAAPKIAGEVNLTKD